MEMEHEERVVRMRMPKRYLEDRFNHAAGIKQGTQLFRIEVPTFEPVTRPEAGRRNAAGPRWDWMYFSVGDWLPLDHTIGLRLELPITVNDIGKPRELPNWRDFPTEPGPYGLTPVLASDRLGDEDLFVHYDATGELAGWMLCSVRGPIGSINEGCRHVARHSDMDVRMSYLCTELPSLAIIYGNIAQFLTCATSDDL